MPRRRKQGARLPPELIERVLSFLPVPVLCRFRTVCKSWKEFLCTSSFRKLCDAHSTRKPYLFVAHTSCDECFRRPSGGTICFLDLDERRWYSIKGEDVLRVHNLHNFGAGVMAIDDCLLRKAKGLAYRTRDLVFFDPIAKSNRIIPLPFKEYATEIPVLVDDDSRSFRIFVIHNMNFAIDVANNRNTLLYMYESTTKNWRAARNPPVDICPILKANCSAFFRGRLYLVSTGSNTCKWNLLSYNWERDSWRLIRDGIRNGLTPSLVESCDRLFLINWVGDQMMTSDSSLWMHEIIDGSICEEGLQIITMLTAMNLFHEVCFNLATVMPMFHSDGSCRSVLFVSDWLGRVCIYHLASQTVDFFPGLLMWEQLSRSGLYTHYPLDWNHSWKKRMDLNLRSMLSPF